MSHGHYGRLSPVSRVTTPSSGSLSDDELEEAPRKQPLIIVSSRSNISIKWLSKNGEPKDWKFDWDISDGGLASGVEASASFTDEVLGDALKGIREPRRVRSFLWIAYIGDVPKDRPEVPVRKTLRYKVAKSLRQKDSIPVFVDLQDYNLYYEVIANELLWPLFHNRVDLMTSSATQLKIAWAAYKRVNQAFLKVMQSVHDYQNARFWIHDYHLMLLPTMLRQASPTAVIGYFHHIPFCPKKYVDALREKGRNDMRLLAKQAIAGILGADLIGVHTETFKANLFALLPSDREKLDCGPSKNPRHFVVRRSEEGKAALESHVHAYPLGISPKKFLNTISNPITGETVRKHEEEMERQLRTTFGRRGIPDDVTLRVIISVDRTDYSKGGQMKTRAVCEFLKNHNHFGSKVWYAYMQIAVPSRGTIKAYRENQKLVNAELAEFPGISRVFYHKLTDEGTSEEGHTVQAPGMWYRFTKVPHEELCAIYHMGAVGLVTPVADGLNLVAYEFSACQTDRPNPGTLVLGTGAGAAETLGNTGGAVKVDAASAEAVVEGMEKAHKWQESGEDAKTNADKLAQYVDKNTAENWGEAFWRVLEDAHHHRQLEMDVGARPEFNPR